MIPKQTTTLGVAFVFALLCLVLAGTSAALQKGNLIGIKVNPATKPQVKALEQLRNSNNGYLFWSSAIKSGSQVGILVPEHLQASFFERMGNLSLTLDIVFDPVYIELYEKEEMGAMNKALVAHVLAMAHQYLTPFIGSASAVLHSALFGSGRAPRSSDIVIYNGSKHQFQLGNHDCHNGILTSGMLPDFRIPAHHGSVFGIQSNGLFSGVSCWVRYAATDHSGAVFQIEVINPYVFDGGPHAVVQEHKHLTVHTTVGGEHNNLVEVHVY